MKQPSLFDQPAQPAALPDQRARDFAVDPRNDVVLEASAGTGKTRVLVERYVRLMEAGVSPRHILAITFTRKAAAEMRDRVLDELRRRSQVPEDFARDIQILTIDAFCFGLLREFPLEADVDPGFQIADETAAARFANEALDLTLRAARALLVGDEPLRLLMTRVKPPVLRTALAALLDRRQLALHAVAHYVRRAAPAGGAAGVAAAFVASLQRVFASPHRIALLDDGPHASPEFGWLRQDIVTMDRVLDQGPAGAQQLRRRLERYFLTKDGAPRRKIGGSFPVELFPTPQARRRHEAAVQALAPGVHLAIEALDRGVNGLLSQGLLRVLAIVVDKYERLLAEHAVLDFPAMLDRSVRLLSRQEEFARSRLKLQSRYHHLLVDEFQDTSRLQWRLVELLVDAWGEGEGVTDAPTSIFVVGDRKQSIYRFRHAEVSLLDEAAGKILQLRPGRVVRQSITTSFRAVPELLSFVNALATSIQSTEAGDEPFVYRESDRFPVPDVSPGALRDGSPVIGLIAEPSIAACASAVAAEIARLVGKTLVRDARGPMRPAAPDDIAVLFRARTGHQYFEEALEARGIRTYVYKGLGFFDAPEVQDLQALIRYLAKPDSDLRAAEFLRSRFVRVSDAALARMAPEFARALRDPGWTAPALEPIDAHLLTAAREALPRWLACADRVPPGELLDLVIGESAYAVEMGGPRLDQARENVKKLRSLVRRVESRGYATLGRLAEYFDTLRTGEESNAAIEATGCVNLMTIHAAKGLEFPIVFIVNLHMPGRGRASGFSVIERGSGGEPEVSFGSSEGTRLEDQRDVEELRRLLYVAVTRARDRVYLAAEIDAKQRVRRGARSLAGLLPESLLDTFAAVARDPAATRVTWDSGYGTFTCDVCRAMDAAPVVTPPLSGDRVATVDLAPLAAPSDRRPRTRPAAAGRADHLTIDEPQNDSRRLLGTLVHRLFQSSTAPDRAAEAAASLVSAEELVDVADRAALITDAAALYQVLRERADVVEVLVSGTCRYEVPITYAPPDEAGGLVRAVVDCIVFAPDGSATVLEFKTGRPRPEHDAQAELYRRAVAAALENTRVKVRIIYP